MTNGKGKYALESPGNAQIQQDAKPLEHCPEQYPTWHTQLDSLPNIFLVYSNIFGGSDSQRPHGPETLPSASYAAPGLLCQQRRFGYLLLLAAASKLRPGQCAFLQTTAGALGFRVFHVFFFDVGSPMFMEPKRRTI